MSLNEFGSKPLERKNTNLPKSNKTSLNFRTARSRKIGSVWETKETFETILIAFFWKVTILFKLELYYRSIPTQKCSKLSKDKLSYNTKYEERL